VRLNMKKKILSADILTPILAYMRVQGDHKVILESIPREKENARFSIVAYNPVFEIKFENGQLTENDKVIESDPLDYLSQITVKSQLSQDLPFNGGAIGFVGYDMVGLYENIGKIPQDTIGTPDMHFFVYESYLIFDHKKEKIVIVEDNIYSGREEEEQKAALQEVLADLKKQAVDEFSERDLHTLTFRNHLEEATFKDMVTKAKKFIRQGDMFQCVLSQRFSADISGKPLDFYRNLRITNPSNYLYFYDFGDYQIIGASPESLVSLKNGVVTTNPIAGTRPRGANDQKDKDLSEELLSDVKEVAEHRMLVDLGRNDIGKIAEVGSVQVTKYMEVEFFRYVMHLTSVVKGKLLSGLTGMDALKSTLPAGTVSGAPKIRAMKRIYELEKEKRGIYAGAIGYLSASGDMDFAIAIRTMIIKNQKAYVQAGAGIVYDSVPENEYYETINKAKAMTRIGEIQ
jgi:anthranilate synthase, component I (EC 4.1.3.27)